MNTILSLVKEKFWIQGAGYLIKCITSKCVVSRKYQTKAMTQEMAVLLKKRLIPDDPPFTHTGMNYFGPVLVKHGRSSVKHYSVTFYVSKQQCCSLGSCFLLEFGFLHSCYTKVHCQTRSSENNKV